MGSVSNKRGKKFCTTSKTPTKNTDMQTFYASLVILEKLEENKLRLYI